MRAMGIAKNTLLNIIVLFPALLLSVKTGYIEDGCTFQPFFNNLLVSEEVSSDSYITQVLNNYQRQTIL